MAKTDDAPQPTVVEQLEQILDGLIDYKEPHLTVVEAQTQIKALLSSTITDVIGNDDLSNKDRARIRNQLRAEQRNRAKEMGL